jgi:hypothetical protein
MAVDRIIEEFQRQSGIDGEWVGQEVREGSPRTVRAIMKTAPPGPSRTEAELMQARVFFGTKLSEGMIEPRVSEEEALAIAIEAEKETVTGKWRIQMSNEGDAKNHSSGTGNPGGNKVPSPAGNS